MGRVAYQAVDLREATATAECERVLREPFAFSSVATCELPGRPARIVGVINGALLRPAFSRVLEASPAPYFHHRVRDAAASPFPTEEEVARANAGSGQDLFFTHYAIDGALDDSGAIRVHLLLAFHFAERYAGNRVRRILVETVGRENTVAAQGAGFETVTSYPDWRTGGAALERDAPHLLAITLEGAMARGSLHLARLLQYRPPAFGFPTGARDLLRLADEGLSDGEIVGRTGMTMPAVNSGWTRIYAIVEAVRPSLFATGRRSGRAWRRAAVLEYVRFHPEELWPYGTV